MQDCSGIFSARKNVPRFEFNGLYDDINSKISKIDWKTKKKLEPLNDPTLTGYTEKIVTVTEKIIFVLLQF